MRYTQSPTTRSRIPLRIRRVLVNLSGSLGCILLLLGMVEGLWSNPTAWAINTVGTVAIILALVLELKSD